MAAKLFNSKDILNITKEVIKSKLPNLSVENCRSCQCQNDFNDMHNVLQVLDKHSCKLKYHMTLVEFKKLLDPIDILLECAKYAKNLRWCMNQLKILLKKKKWLKTLYESYN